MFNSVEPRRWSRSQRVSRCPRGQKGSSDKQSTAKLKRYRDVLRNASTMVKAQFATKAGEIGHTRVTGTAELTADLIRGNDGDWKSGGVKAFNFLITAGAIVWDTQESKSNREMLCIIGNLEGRNGSREITIKPKEITMVGSGSHGTAINMSVFVTTMEGSVCAQTGMETSTTDFIDFHKLCGSM